MEIRLKQSDLDAMPDPLRRDLFAHLEARCAPSREEATVVGFSFGRREVAALLREISFDRLGRNLRRLLMELAYEDGAKPPTREKLAQALPAAERANVGRYVAALNRVAARAARRKGMKLCHYDRRTTAYAVDPTTRQALRNFLPQIEHAGEREEPLWET